MNNKTPTFITKDDQRKYLERLEQKVKSKTPLTDAEESALKEQDQHDRYDWYVERNK